jgi:hypothetical protein
MAAPEQTLEALVRDELRGPISEVVRRVVVELVREQLNGDLVVAESTAGAPKNAQEPRRRSGPTTPKPAPPERHCNRCGETKPAGEYAPGRGTCCDCRRAQQREHDRRVAQADSEEPHPAPSPPQRGRRGARRLERDRVWSERRRALIEAARRNGVTSETIDGQTFTVLPLAPG